jgi:hypothetical protein
MVTQRAAAAVFAGVVLASGPWGSQLLAAGQGQAFLTAAPALPTSANPLPAEDAESLADALATSQASVAHGEGHPSPVYPAAGALVKTRDPRAAKALLDAYEKATDLAKGQLAWLLWSARDIASPEDAEKIDKLVGSKFKPPTQF